MSECVKNLKDRVREREREEEEKREKQKQWVFGEKSP